MDMIDALLLQRLSEDGRATWADLARVVGLSPAATAERVHRLESRGVITGYYAAIDAEQVGQGLLAFISVSLERPQHRADFLYWVQKHDEVQECHHLAGDDDYLLKVRCASTRALERLISEDLKSLDGIVRTRTTIAMSSVKDVPGFALLTRASTGEAASAAQSSGGRSVANDTDGR